MPSTATITAFYTFVPLTKIRSAHVNNNFDVFRGHSLPVNTDTATSSNLTHDLGANGHAWRGVYNQYGVMYGNTTSSVPSNPASGYYALYFKDDGFLYSKDSSGTENQITPATGAEADWNVTSIKTSAYTLTVGELCRVNASGGAFSIYFPTAVGNSGKKVGVLKVNEDASFNAVAMVPSGVQTIDDASSKNVCTSGEFFSFVSDGSNWKLEEHTIPNKLLYSTLATACLTTTGNALGAGTLSVNVFNMYRDGQFAVVNFTVVQTSSVGATNGTGCYLAKVPVNINTSNLTVNSNTTVPTSAAPGNIEGFIQAHNNSATGQFGAIVHSTTTVHFTGISSVAGSTMWGAGGTANWAFSTGGNNMAISGWFKFPVQGWEP